MNKADVFTKQSRLAEVIEEYRDDMRYFIVIMDRSVRVRR
jgi:hypothetical protein